MKVVSKDFSAPSRNIMYKFKICVEVKPWHFYMINWQIIITKHINNIWLIVLFLFVLVKTTDNNKKLYIMYINNIVKWLPSCLLVLTLLGVDIFRNGSLFIFQCRYLVDTNHLLITHQYLQNSIIFS